MSQFDTTLALFEEFQKNYNAQPPNLDKCKSIMNQLKLAILKMNVPLPGALGSDSASRELLLIREVLEHAVLLSVKLEDIPSFERYFAQLRPFYFDYGKTLQPSARQYAIIGLNLLRLLAKNSIAEFHTELELIPIEQHNQNVYIRHPISLEQFLMEGSYHKVRAARAHVPADFYHYFMDILMDTVRDQMASCSEKAFNKLPSNEAHKLFQISDEKQFNKYAEERGWSVTKDTVTFGQIEETKNSIPSLLLIKETLTYARELERIV